MTTHARRVSVLAVDARVRGQGTEPGGTGRLAFGRNRQAVLLAIGLAALALVAFLVRLVGLVRGPGMLGILGHDDAVYYTAAVAFVEGRLPYRDFNILHPPGIVYLLSPFAALGGVTGDSTGFAIARLAVMVLGAVNTVLVGLVGRRAGTTAAICAAALYAVWVAPAAWERTTYLVAPQATLLLVALHLLTGRAPETLTPRRVALAGACLGVAGVIQVWTFIPAAVIFGWLLLTYRSNVRTLVRMSAAYVAGGGATAVVLLLPFIATTGRQMIDLIVFAQLRRTGAFSTGHVTRLRFLEGVPLNDQFQRVLPGVPTLAVNAAVVALFAAAAVFILYVAWRRPEIRLWAALLAVQTVFLMWTPVFYGHYAGWTAPLAALCIGASAATIFDALRPAGRQLAIGAFAIGLTALLFVALHPRGERVPIGADEPGLAAARCVTADEVILLISTEAVRRDLRNGCAFLPNPSGVVNAMYGSRGGPRLQRADNPDYQAAMERYYGSSDAALFLRLDHAALTDDTLATIREQLPFERRVGDVLLLFRQAP